MRKKIVGRKKECERLQKCLDSSAAELFVVYGRRRVGKTYLVNQFFDGRFDFKVTGLYGESKERQFKVFMTELDNQTQRKNPFPTDWIDAFNLLKQYLKSLPQDEKHIVFFDEFPWFDTAKSGFLAAFEWFWNDWAVTQDNLVLLICGSATSWMVENIDRNKGGLFNRQTARLYLEPFSLKETEEYLKSRGFEWSRYDIAECYMIMGGIPFYLSQLDPELDYTRNIDMLFFRKRAVLWDEFQHLYNTLFSNSEVHIKIVEALSSKRIGLTRTEILEKTKHASNGLFSNALENLVNSGFVRVYPYFGDKKTKTLYQLSDYYTMFYYKFLKDKTGKAEDFWSNGIGSPSRNAWAGFTFEQLCKDHLLEIKRKLGISGVLSKESSWFVQGTEEQPGSQNDMLIDRDDRIINLCEMKFSTREFEIDKEYQQNLLNKIDTFRTCSKTRKNLQLTFISTFGVKKNMYSGMVQRQIVLDDFFE
ncbi:MAG: ATP-binding protein [Spirochaetales bacterium]|nr:ATP-binding protein [Candidatus Physcosoma equi]